MIGIYGIRNKNSNKIYVGQSKRMKKRWKDHIRDLKSEKHCNSHLLNSFKKYGEDCFEFLVLEECEESELNAKEEEWINRFSKDLVYNQNMHILDLKGEHNPFYLS